MTVINSTEHYLFEHTVCSICRGALHPPFVSWDGAELAVLRICATCCRRHRNGLMADMVQVAAIGELGQRHKTLVRKSNDEVEADERKHKEWILNPEA